MNLTRRELDMVKKARSLPHTTSICGIIWDNVPALLDMAEQLLALEWADEWRVMRYDYETSDDESNAIKNPCESCPMRDEWCWNGPMEDEACWNPWQYKDEWLKAYRERSDK